MSSGKKALPSKSPTKYWALDPPVSPLAPIETVRIHRVSPVAASVSGNRSGHSHTAAWEPAPCPKSPARSHPSRSVDRWNSTWSPAQTTMTQARDGSCQKTLGSRKSVRPSLAMTGLCAKRSHVRPRSVL